MTPRAIFAAMCLLTTMVLADPVRADSWGIEFDNDRIVNTDRHFTHGTRLFWLSDTDDTPDWAHRLADHLPRVDAPGKLRLGVTIGQNMFTPDDITETQVIEDDRPYAGWLYGGLSLERVSAGNRRAAELDLGVVGPASLARQTQIVVHEVFNTTIPRGWANQLRNEPGIALLYEEQWQYIVPFDDGDGIRAAFTPHIAGSLGNIYTYAGAGGSVRIGRFADDDFGQTRIRPGVPGSDSVAGRDGIDWYLFAGLDGRLVARNIFLDGNTFTDSHSVDKRPAVLDLQFGATVAFPTFRLTVMQVFRSREFEHQSDADRFGVVQAGFRF